MLTIEKMRRKQERLKKKWAQEAKLEAEKEAQRVAKIEAELREQEEIAARKRLLLEQREDERLRKKYIQKKEKLAEEKWIKQSNALMAQIKARRQKDDKLEEIKIIIRNREPTLQQLDWDSWLSDPLNQRLADLDFERAMEMFKRDNFMAKRRKRTKGKPKRFNYGLSFTGNDASGARADLVATSFTPNDPTNKGFAEGSGRKPLAESGFTISYWWRPDENYSDSFAIGWKRDEHARFGFGIRNASKPWFEIGTSEVNNTTWADMFDDSGNSDLKNTLLDNGEGTDPGSGNKLILGKWYHIVVTYAGTDNPDGDENMLQKFYINGYHIYGGFGEGKQSVNWTSHTGAQMARGLAFGMRMVIASGTDSESGLRNAKYNNGNACGLDEIAIYNEAKDAAWVASVYNGGTSYHHIISGGNGLVAYWRFNEGIGTTVKDSGPYGWHGTLTNASHGTKIDTGIDSLPPSGTPTWIKAPKGYGQ
jgi:hypothetical protein